MVRRRSVSLVAIVGVTLGCGDSGGTDRPDGAPPGFIVWTEPISDSLHAMVQGVVTVADDGCVYLGRPSSPEREPAIWPFGTTFDGTVIRTTDGVEIRDGDPVYGSGGEVEYQYEYYIENTTLSVDLDLLHECGDISGDRIPASNPLGPITLGTFPSRCESGTSRRSPERERGRPLWPDSKDVTRRALDIGLAAVASSSCHDESATG